MKKKITLLALALMSVSILTACSGGQSQVDEKTVVAIVKQLDHASMDEIAMATEKQLKEKYENVEVLQLSGQNDASTLAQMGAELVADEVDSIVPVGTLAAQQIVVATEGTDVPVIYTGVADPELGGLVDIENTTGVSHDVMTEFVLDMIFKVDSEVKTVGLLYSSSQINSLKPIEDAKAYLDAKGIAYVEKTGNTTDEIIAAVNSMIDKVDVIFTPTDNIVMASELAIAEILAENGVAHFTPADSFARNGAFVAAGVSFTEVGYKTADMVMEIVEGGEIGDYYKMTGDIITVNTETAEILGIDYSVLQDMSTTDIIEVQTTIN